MKPPDAILCADIHARETTPICRLDEDYVQAQIDKWIWLDSLQKKHGCPILHAGDLFEIWKSSPYLLTLAIRYLPNNIITIPGNHDLPAHNLDRIDECGLAVLNQSKKVVVLGEEETVISSIPGNKFSLNTFPWGRGIKPPSDKNKGLPRVAMAHAEVYQVKKPYPGASPDGKAVQILKNNPDYDLIVTGHNHESFTASYRGRLLVNPGSLMRDDTTQMDYRPRVFLWYAEDNTIEPIDVPVKPGMISREHLDVIKDRDERLEAFVSRLKEVKNITLHFEKNLEKFFSINKTKAAVEELAWEFTQGGEK